MDDITGLIAEARKQGFGVTRLRSGHLKLTPPSRAAPLIIVSGSPSDYRALAKIRSQLRRAGLTLPAPSTTTPTSKETPMARRQTTPTKPSRSQRASAMSGKTAATRVPRRVVVGDDDSALQPLTAAQAAQVERESRALTSGDTLTAETKLDRDLAHLGDPQAGRRVPSRRRREPDEEPLVYRGKRGRGTVDQHIDIIVPDEENDERIYELQATISGLDEDSQREAWARAAALRNREPEPYVPLTDRLTVSGIHYHLELGKSTLVHVDDVDYLLSYPAYVIERVGDNPDESGLPAAIRRRNATALASQQRRAS